MSENEKNELAQKFELMADEITDLFAIDFRKSTEEVVEQTFQDIADEHGAVPVYESGFNAGAMAALIWLWNRYRAEQSGEYPDLFNEAVFDELHLAEEADEELDDLCDLLFNPDHYDFGGEGE
jgi:hypothetical protein